MRCRVLGSVELVDADGRPRQVGSANQRLLLASLVAQRGRIVAVEALVDTLWADDPPPSAVPTLRTYVSRLRQHLGEAVRSHPAGWSLVLAADELDASLFESMLNDVDHRAGTDQIDVLRAAVALWRGPAFGSEREAPLVRGEAVRLHERALQARVRLAAAELDEGRVDDSVAEAEALVAEVPHHEPAWVVLVRALSAAGRTVDALRAFQRAADVLADVGLEPSAALRAAERDVLAPAAPPADTVSAASIVRRTGPPSAPSPLIGRADDLDAVLGLIGRVRLLTLVGTGGVGKTRLANEVAHRVGGPTSAPLRNLVVLLHRAGRAAEVAVLSGSIDRDSLTLYPDEVERLGEAREWARDQLGDERYELLRREGEERDITGAAMWAVATLRRPTD